MSRYKRLYYSQAVYHVVFRGNNRLEVLLEEPAKKVLLKIIERYRQRFGFALYAFVIMDNHAHLVLETNETHNISRVMQSILLAFSCWYRRNYNYVGYVWQGRFKSFCISNERYLRECVEYIHQNPVRAKMVDYPEGYLWSSARQYAGMGDEAVRELLIVNQFVLGDSSATSH